VFDYRASLIRIIDADTVIFLLDQGLSDRAEEPLRLLRTWAPEVRKNELGAVECIAFVRDWLDESIAVATAAGRRWPFYVLTDPNTNPEPEARETLARYLGTVFDFVDRRRCLNTELTAYIAAHPEWGPGIT
jgi:hypothetical protein